MSPDGKHVYVAGGVGNAVAVFSRNATTGALTYSETQSHSVSGAAGLRGAWSLVVSPDGAHVYVAGRSDDAIAVFRRDMSTGRLTFLEAEGDGINGVDGLNGAWSVAISPDGEFVYAGALDENAISVFRRDASSGRLTFIEAQHNGMSIATGLAGAGGAAVSPDGAYLYVTGSRDHTVASFRVGGLDPSASLDSFKCYKARSAKGSQKFIPTQLQLQDRFGSFVATVRTPDGLCSPAAENSDRLVDATTHLQGYKLRLPQSGPLRKRTQSATLRVVNQFGELFVATQRARRLLVPTAASLVGSPSAPDPTSHNVDHYTCYAVKPVKSKLCTVDAPSNPLSSCRHEEDCGGASGATSFCFTPPTFGKTTRAALTDQLASGRAFRVITAVEFCAAADTNAEGMKNPDTHLMCYRLKPTRGQCTADAPKNPDSGCNAEGECGGQRGETDFCAPQEQFQRVLGLNVANELGSGLLSLRKEHQLCVPSRME